MPDFPGCAAARWDGRHKRERCRSRDAMCRPGRLAWRGEELRSSNVEPTLPTCRAGIINLDDHRWVLSDVSGRSESPASVALSENPVFPPPGFSIWRGTSALRHRHRLLRLPAYYPEHDPHLVTRHS